MLVTNVSPIAMVRFVPMALEHQVLYSDSGLVLASIGTPPIVIAVWRGAVTPERLRAHLPAFQPMIKRGQRWSTLSIMTSEMNPTTDAAVREEANKLSLACDSSQIAVANVIEGTGFVAASFRAAISGLNLFNRLNTPRKVFDNAHTAIVWLLEQHPTTTPPISATMLYNSVTTLRSV